MLSYCGDQIQVYKTPKTRQPLIRGLVFGLQTFGGAKSSHNKFNGLFTLILSHFYLLNHGFESCRLPRGILAPRATLRNNMKTRTKANW
jgi:hypothetical protein